MANEVTKEDLWHLQEVVTDAMKEGFDGVHRRQDVTNGRIAANEGTTREHGVQLKNLEREVFHRRRGDHDDGTDLAPVRGRWISDRDVKIAYLTLAAIIAAIEAVRTLWPWLKLLTK